MGWGRAVIGAVILLVGTLAAVRPGHADHPTGAAPPALPSAFLDAGTLAKRVREALARYQAADPRIRAQALRDLVAVTQARARRLAALIEDAPEQVLRTALGAEERSQFPREARAHLEEDATEQGQVDVLHEDRWDGERYLHFLHARRGRLALHFAGRPPGLLTGDQVEVRGVRVGEAVAADSGSGVTVVSAALAHTFGEQKTLVIVVNFSNTTAYTASTVNQISSVMFGSGSSVARYYQEASYDETWLTGAVVGPYPIALTSSACDFWGISSQARQAATNAGVNVSAYRRHVIAFPSNACGWWGLGTVGGNPSTAWVNGSFQNGVAVHELGHNFGLYHSHALDCGAAVVGGSCSSLEYGDTLDVMGAATPPRHFNAVQKELLGWLNYSGMPPITAVQASGVYALDPYVPAGSGPKALKVRAANGDWYYVEYRRPDGFDATIPSSVASGVVVHLLRGQSPDGIYLLDMTPATASWTDPALAVNKTFEDTAAGLSITPLWADASGAGVSVTLGTSSCARAVPLVSVSPPERQGPPGATVTYTVAVQNRDSGCAATTFTTQASKPGGWSATFAAPSLTVPAGGTVSTTLSVTSSPNAPAGSYGIGVTASDASTPGHTNSASATYEVTTTGIPGSFTDDFNRGDSLTLGPRWTQISGSLRIQDGEVRGGEGRGMNLAIANELVGATQSARASFARVNRNSSPRFGVLLRYQDARNYYACYRQTGTANFVRIVRVLNGTPTVLSNAPVPNPGKGEPFEIRCRVDGASLALELNGVLKVTGADASLASGHVGLVIKNPGKARQAAKALANRADDFVAQVR